MSETICFYHNADFDGKCSAAIVCRHIPDVVLYGIDYGEEFPFGQCNSRDVVMVDFSIQPFNQMTMLSDFCRVAGQRFIWVDHHKSAIEEAERANFNPPGKRRVGRAACELCWEYFAETEMPTAIYLLGRYDVWDHEDPRVLPFQCGMRQDEWHPRNSKWGELFCSEQMVNEIKQQGVLLQRYQAKQNELYAKARSYSVAVPTGDTRVFIRGIVCNKGLTSSQLFDSVYSEDKHDVMVAFSKLPVGPFEDADKLRWTVSLYSTKSDVDCSAIAKMYGGGGHKGAAGFQCVNLPAWLS